MIKKKEKEKEKVTERSEIKHIYYKSKDKGLCFFCLSVLESMFSPDYGFRVSGFGLWVDGMKSLQQIKSESYTQYYKKTEYIHIKF